MGRIMLFLLFLIILQNILCERLVGSTDSGSDLRGLYYATVAFEASTSWVSSSSIAQLAALK